MIWRWARGSASVRMISPGAATNGPPAIGAAISVTPVSVATAASGSGVSVFSKTAPLRHSSAAITASRTISGTRANRTDGDSERALIS